MNEAGSPGLHLIAMKSWNDVLEVKGIVYGPQTRVGPLHPGTPWRIDNLKPTPRRQRPAEAVGLTLNCRREPWPMSRVREPRWSHRAAARPDAACRSPGHEPARQRRRLLCLPAMASELQQLEATIQGLESQRALLGGVVDAALGPLRDRLATLRAAGADAHPVPALRQLSILFMDSVGSTALAEHLTPRRSLRS